MKKIIFLVLATLAICYGLTSCSDDDADFCYNHTLSPEEEAEGIYSGEICRVQANSSSAVEEKSEGTMTVVKSEQKNVAFLKFSCTELGISTVDIPVNIAYENDGILFSNHIVENPLGSIITGRIDANKKVTTNFQLKIRSGRVTKVYNISFTGIRN
ncbi:MAG: hypothetical protein ACI4BA_01355 [Prevotella sp.]